MDTAEYLKGNNPPRGDTYILMCGKNFFEAIKGAMEKLTPEVKAKIVNRYINKVSKTWVHSQVTQSPTADNSSVSGTYFMFFHIFLFNFRVFL